MNDSVYSAIALIVPVHLLHMYSPTCLKQAPVLSKHLLILHVNEPRLSKHLSLVSVPILALKQTLISSITLKRNNLPWVFKLCQMSKLSSHLPDAIIHCLLSQKIILDNLSRGT